MRIPPLLTVLCITLITCAGALSSAAVTDARAEDKVVLLVSEEWEDATNADGTGFYWELARAVFEPAGYTVKHEVYPYARAVNMVGSKEAHGWMGSYIDEENFAVYPQHAFDADSVSAASRPGEFDDAAGVANLAGKRVGWVRGYSYDDFIDVDFGQPHLLSNLEGGLKMVEAKRLDYVLDAAMELKNAGLEAKGLEYHKLMDLELYIAFADTEEGRALAQLWDKRLEAMHAAGELKPIYEQHGYTEYYPF